MVLSAQPPPVFRNRLLAALPPEALARLWPQLTLVELSSRQVLCAPEQPITAVYFPETGCVSMLAYMQDGHPTEVGHIGHDGIVGFPILLEGDRDGLETMVRHSGTAWRMGAALFREELAQIPFLRSLLRRYALVHYEQVARAAACNGRHGIRQRLARWLLMAHDRIEGDTFPVTHEYLSIMLGVRRAGITETAGALHKAGIICSARGQITVRDRLGLESAACECYGSVRRAWDRLYGQQDKAPALVCN